MFAECTLKIVWWSLNSDKSTLKKLWSAPDWFEFWSTGSCSHGSAVTGPGSCQLGEFCWECCMWRCQQHPTTKRKQYTIWQIFQNSPSHFDIPSLWCCNGTFICSFMMFVQKDFLIAGAAKTCFSFYLKPTGCNAENRIRSRKKENITHTFFFLSEFYIQNK